MINSFYNKNKKIKILRLKLIIKKHKIMTEEYLKKE